MHASREGVTLQPRVKRLLLNLFCVCAAFLNMLCSSKWGIYIFFGVWQFIAILFTLFLVPETRGVPIEEVTFCQSQSHPCLAAIIQTFS